MGQCLPCLRPDPSHQAKKQTSNPKEIIAFKSIKSASSNETIKIESRFYDKRIVSKLKYYISMHKWKKHDLLDKCVFRMNIIILVFISLYLIGMSFSTPSSPCSTKSGVGLFFYDEKQESCAIPGYYFDSHKYM